MEAWRVSPCRCPTAARLRTRSAPFDGRESGSPQAISERPNDLGSARPDFAAIARIAPVPPEGGHIRKDRERPAYTSGESRIDHCERPPLHDDVDTRDAQHVAKLVGGDVLHGSGIRRLAGFGLGESKRTGRV